MKLKSILLATLYVFSTYAWDTQAPRLELGNYTVRDVTGSYPRENFYDQVQDCVQTAVTGADITPPDVPAQPSYSNIIGMISGSGDTTASSGFSGSGGVVIEPPGNAGGSIAPTLPYYPGSGNVRLDNIVNVGTFVWALVERSKPTMKVSTYRAHGLPSGVSCWTDLEEWKIPKSFVYTVEQKAKTGQVLAKFTFRISYVYGGHFNGKGRYLANVTVSPVDLKVGWATDFASEVHIPTVFNVGTKADPLAAMQIYVYWSLGKTTNMQQKSLLFHLTGDGKIQLTDEQR